MSRPVRLCFFSLCFALLLFTFQPATQFAAAANKQSGDSLLVYVGTYTDANSKGIYAYRANLETNKIESLGLAAEVISPSWITVHPNHQVLYAGSYDGKSPEGFIYSYRIDARTGGLTLLNKVSAGGGEPIHLAIDKTQKLLLAANYVGGQVAAFALNPDGSIGKQTALIPQTGSSANARRQKSPHPHQIVIAADNRHVLVPDLGVDKVYNYQLDPKKGTLAPGTPAFFAVPAGSGPRHLAFHPNGRFAYLITELDPTLTTFSYTRTTGELKQLQNMTTLPDGYTGPKSGSEVWVEPAGRVLYAADRSNDTLQVYSIDRQKGTLALIQRVPSQGKTPRHFAVDPSGQYLFVANQKSDNVMIFKIDSSSGKLEPTDNMLKVPTPTCVTFIPEKQ